MTDTKSTTVPNRPIKSYKLVLMQTTFLWSPKLHSQIKSSKQKPGAAKQQKINHDTKARTYKLELELLTVQGLRF